MIRRLLSNVVKYLFEMKECLSLEYAHMSKQPPIHKMCRAWFSQQLQKVNLLGLGFHCFPSTEDNGKQFLLI